jgi:hypothetical protein
MLTKNKTSSVLCLLYLVTASKCWESNFKRTTSILLSEIADSISGSVGAVKPCDCCMQRLRRLMQCQSFSGIAAVCSRSNDTDSVYGSYEKYICIDRITSRFLMHLFVIL